MNQKTVVIASSLALLAAFALAAWWFQGHEAERVEAVAEESATTLVPESAMTFGPPDARVTIVEFFDPACETCAMFHKPVKDLVEAHPGQVRLVLRYAPFHQGSEEVVKILEASRAQDKYWETLDLLFASQSRWASHHAPRPDLIWQFLPMVGVDVDRIRADVGGFAMDDLVKRDLADAATLGIRKTPGFLVNGKPLPSFGFAQLQTLVESEIAAHY